ncbi:MAG: AAA family ATPase [Candidatus Doudnabacteria bacterium]|nr:AAA family ATPase [Candidatus Doudnabacteria bacterium]
MILAVEGIDFAGKGEVCPRLARRLGAILYKTPPEHMREEQNRINASATDQDHYRYFVGVVQQASAEIREVSKFQNVVLDRYWMTTVVYHRVMGVAADIRDFGNIVMPDATVYLTVSPEVQRERMAKREMSPGDVRMLGRFHLVRQGYENALSDTQRVIRVDTTQLTPEEVVDLVFVQIQLVR